MRDLPTDLIKNIADYMDIGSAYQLSRANKIFHKTLNGNYFFSRQLAHKEMLPATLNAALKGIEIYLAKDKAHPGWQEEHWTGNYDLKYDKGFHRANCYKWILDGKFSPHFKLLAVYSLLNEKNGTQLKSRVVHELKIRAGFNFIKKALCQFYDISEDKLNTIKDLMVKAILNEKNAHEYKDQVYNSDYDEKWAETLEAQVIQLTTKRKFLAPRRY